MYKFQERKENIQSIGDSLLYNLTGYNQYNSLSQKISVKEAIQLKGGETLLVSLPTGGGKSLVGQLPALINREERSIYCNSTYDSTSNRSKKKVQESYLKDVKHTLEHTIQV